VTCLSQESLACIENAYDLLITWAASASASSLPGVRQHHEIGDKNSHPQDRLRGISRKIPMFHPVAAFAVDVIVWKVVTWLRHSRETIIIFVINHWLLVNPFPRGRDLSPSRIVEAENCSSSGFACGI
jgi:hypothetical protein